MGWVDIGTSPGVNYLLITYRSTYVVFDPDKCDLSSKGPLTKKFQLFSVLLHKNDTLIQPQFFLSKIDPPSCRVYILE
jgi:hypothetical protein